jgi:DNA-binding beta-propeller fold protein YncE
MPLGRCRASAASLNGFALNKRAGISISVSSKEVWVAVRGENYVAVLDGTTYHEKTRIVVANGPGMTIFSPDGKFGYVCSSFTPETAVISVNDHKIVGKVQQARKDLSRA